MAQFSTVAAITGNGTVFAIDAQGKSRVLKVGDTLQKGETVRTVGDVRVELMMEDGRLLAVAPAQSVRLDENVVESDQRPTTQDSAVAAPATADTVIQALERGGDLSIELEATAAGLAPGGAVDGGSSFVQLLRIVEGVEPLSYNYSFAAPGPIPTVEALPELVPTTANGTLDDVPVLSVAADDLTVEEDDLNNANAVGNNEDGSTDAHIASGNLADNFDFGADGPAATKVVSVGYDGDTYTADEDGNITIATAGWEIVVDAETGDYTFELLDNQSHADDDANDENWLGEDGKLAIALAVTVADADGDEIEGNVTVNVDVQDDVPTTTGVSLVFDESLSEAGANEVTTASVASLEAAAESVSGFDLTALNATQGSVTASGGADGLAGFALTATTGSLSGLTTSVTDLPITWVKVNDSLVLGVTGYNGTDGTYTGVALSLHMDTTSGQFTVIQYAALTNPTGGSSYDELLSAAVSVGYVAIDGDGDRAPGTISFNVEDDGLLANPDAITAAAVGSYTGNLLGNDVAGVDGIDRVTSITVGTTTYTIADGSSVTINLVTHNETGHGAPRTVVDQTLTVYSDGSYTYNVINYNGDATIPDVTYTIVDGDGDTSTADIDFKLLNTAYLIVNTNNPGGDSTGLEQQFNIYITNDETVLATSATLQDQEGQQKLPLEFDNDVVFTPGQSYTVVIDHTLGDAHTNITDFTLYDQNGGGVVLNGPGGSDNTAIVDDGVNSPSAYDGVIYNLNVALNGTVNVSDAIGYDLGVESSGDPLDDGNVLILDSNGSNTSFTLDFHDLPLTNGGSTDLFGEIKKIDISGDNNENNTIAIDVNDVLDLGSGGDHALFITGSSGDEVKMSGGWTDTSTTQTVDGVTYDIYTATVDAVTATLMIADEITKTNI